MINFTNFYKNLTLLRKKQFLFLIFLTFLSSIFESLSIGVVLPFISFISNPDGFYAKNILLWLSERGLNINKRDAIYLVSFFLCLSAIFAAFSRANLLKVSTTLAFGISSDWSYFLYSKMIKSNYVEIIKSNSANIIGNIVQRSSMLAFYYVVPIINIFVSIVVGTFIISFLLWVNFIATLISASFFILIYYFISRHTTENLKHDSRIIYEGTDYKTRYVQETFFNMRDIILEGKSDIYIQHFLNNEILLKNAQSRSQYLSFYPKFFLEAFSIVLLVLLVATLPFFGFDTPEEILPSIAALALGAQKIIPLLQQIYSSIAAIHTGKVSVKALMAPFNNTTITDAIVKNINLPFLDKIEFKNVTFSYDSRSPTLKNINLIIKKGDIIGINGKSGSGKSTLVDLIMGLISPVEGSISVDNISINSENIRSWMNNIAYASQNTFIFRDSLKNNVCTNSKSYNRKKFLRTIKLARLDVFLNANNENYQLSELGKNISDGQRQRIGIARAIYRDKSLLVLDEATNALDDLTEKHIMKNLKKAGYTIILVTHKKHLLEYCNRVITVENKKIKN